MTQPPAASGPGPTFGSAPEPGPVPGPDRSRPTAGPVRALALIAAGLGLVIYLLGFVGEVSVTSSFGGPLLVGGGLLAGAAALPRVGRVLAPAAVLVITGALLLLQLVIGIGGPTVVVVAMVLALLETAAVIGALLLDTGLVAVRAARPWPAPSYPESNLGYPPVPRTTAGPPGLGYGLGPTGSAPTGYGLPGDRDAYAGPPAVAIGPAPATSHPAPGRPTSGPAGAGGESAVGGPRSGPGPPGTEQPAESPGIDPGGYGPPRHREPGAAPSGPSRHAAGAPSPDPNRAENA